MLSWEYPPLVVGRTPLVRLNRITDGAKATLHVRALAADGSDAYPIDRFAPAKKA